MNLHCRTLLLLFIASYRLNNEKFVEAAPTSEFEQPQDTGTQTAATLGGSISTLLSSLGVSIVTDVNSGGHRLAEIFVDPATNKIVGCNLFGDGNLIDIILDKILGITVTDVSSEEMDQLANVCINVTPMTNGSSILDALGDTLHSLVIFPGTKWCGAGNVASNYDDLGPAVGTDRCCRDHDHADAIGASETEHNITNHMFYSLTSCPDDRKFYNCLLNDSSVTSLAVGVIYFDILKPQCFEYGYPTKCTDTGSSTQQQCEPDTSQPKEWHVVDDPSFPGGWDVESETNETAASL